MSEIQVGGGISGLGNPGRGRGLEVQEIREQGGSKTLAIRRGVWIFSGITHSTQTRGLVSKETVVLHQ